MSHYLVTVAFQAASGLAEDQMVNTFHVEASTDAEAADFLSDVLDFYNTGHGGFTNPITYYMSPFLSGTYNAKAYDLSDPAPRLPVATGTGIFTPRTLIGGLPEEVALCLSFAATPYTPGINPQSQRGRIYIGPLNPEAFAGYGGGDEWNTPPRPATGLLNIVSAAATDLAAANTATKKWEVYSPTLSQGFEVTSGWIDNAFDTQRRRGVAATARTLWT